MAGKTLNEEQSEPAETEKSTTIRADPILVRQQQLHQQLQQINGRIMELRQQESLVRDMITDATIQAAEVRGALKEIQKG